MGLLDGIRERVSGAISSVKEATTTVVAKAEKAVDPGQSTFDPKPSAPPPAQAAPAPSTNPTISAKSIASGPGAVRGALDQALVTNGLFGSKTPEAPLTAA